MTRRYSVLGEDLPGISYGSPTKPSYSTIIQQESAVVQESSHRIGTDCYAVGGIFWVSASQLDLLDIIHEILKTRGRVEILPSGYGETFFDVFSNDDKMTHHVTVNITEQSRRIYTEILQGVSEINLLIICKNTQIRNLYEDISNSLRKLCLPIIKWYYNGAGMELRHSSFPVVAPEVFSESFYPWLAEYGGAKGLGDSYLKSSSSVLIMLGEPGTGKSSWIANFLVTNGLSCTLSHDSKSLASDDFYQQFITDSNQVLVIEDADSLLADRSENPTMTKLLSTSDGLVRPPSKKIIMTSNLDSSIGIDPALMRRGRCFAVVRGRALSQAEAAAAAAAAGVRDPGVSCSLASLWNQDERAGSSYNEPSVGF